MSRYRHCARIACIVGAVGLVASVHGTDRTIDGSANNPINNSMGAAGTNLIFMGAPTYADGISQMRSGPNPREISNAIFAQTGSITNSRNLSDFVWAWGQFLDHDIDLTTEGTEAAPIAVPAGDPWFDPGNTGTQQIDFHRSNFDPSTGTSVANPRKHDNAITTWIDGSNVYGSDAGRANWLRTGNGGKLKTQSHATGDMMPFNDGSQDNAGGNGTDLFVGGDVRANEHAVLSSMHTLFLREHNRLADEIAAANPGWTDEQVYQRARKINGAQIQSITYNEFLPALLGHDLGSGSYDQNVDPSISTEFSTAAYRLGHSMLSSTIHRLDENRNVIPDGNLALADAFFRTDRLLTEGGTDPLFRGLAHNNMQEIDTNLIDDVRNLLFGPPGAGGLDLASLNIQRGRDHGVGTYNDIRIAMGLSAKNTFLELTGGDVALAAQLGSVYSSVGEVDAWVGMLAEPHLPGSSVGELIDAILSDQFIRLRDGDAYFYEWDPDMASLVGDIDSTRLSDIILRNTGIQGIQRNVFIVPAPAGIALLGLGGLAMVRRRR